MSRLFRNPIGNKKQALAFGLFSSALVIRLFLIGTFSTPNIVYVPIEIILCGWALYLERSRLSQFFVGFKNWRGDLVWGVIAAIIWCSLEYSIEGRFSGQEKSFYWDSFFMIPAFLVIAGWRAGVYEELLFRSLLMGYGESALRSPVGAVLLQAIVFWAGHPRYYMHGLWAHSASNFLFGLLMGVIAYKRRSILSSVVVHSISNTYGIVGMPLAAAFPKAIESWFH